MKGEDSCYHCGDPCGENPIFSDNKSFCCNGCLTVYQILKENDLCDYYSFEKTPGINRKNIDDEQYSVLDNKEIASPFILFQSEKLVRAKLRIPSIHCSSCIWLLENLDRINPGVLNSEVDFSLKNLTVDFDPQKIELSGVASLINSLGYKPEINLEAASGRSRSSYQKETVIKLGVAGFIFGNVMLLSFPDYFGFEVEPQFATYFGWLCLILSIPSVLYCGFGYFRSAIKGLKGKFLTIDVPIAIGILALFGRSIYEVIYFSGTGYLDSLTGLIFFLLIGKWFQDKTYQSLSFDRDYRSYFPLGIIRIKNDTEEIVPVNQLRIGDIIRVRNREIIPADSQLLSTTANIDYSFVTGESEPVKINEKERIFAGARQIGATINLKVLKEVSQSYLTQLWNKDQNEENHWETLTNKVAKYFTAIVISVAIMTLVVWLILKPAIAINAFTAVLIVACPCALALASPFALSTAMSIMGRNGLYLRNSTIAEKLARIKRIVFDKTGTLTDKGNPSGFNGTLKEIELSQVGALASHSTHPFSRFIRSMIPDENSQHKIEDYEEIEGKGVRAMVDGILIKMGSNSFVKSGNSENAETEKELSKVYVSFDGELRGFLNIPQSYRKGLPALMNALKDKFQLDLISGDTEKEKHDLSKIFPDGSLLLFRQSPTDKMKFIQNVKNENFQVAMIGDGLNDAGALAISDVGIAVTDDISAFTPSSHAIMMGNKLNLLPRFFKLAKSTRNIIIASFVISFLYNIGGLAFAVTGILSPLIAAILMPVSSITVVAFSTLMVRLKAKRLNLL